MGVKTMNSLNKKLIKKKMLHLHVMYLVAILQIYNVESMSLVITILCY